MLFTREASDFEAAKIVPRQQREHRRFFSSSPGEGIRFWAIRDAKMEVKRSIKALTRQALLYVWLWMCYCCVSYYTAFSVFTDVKCILNAIMSYKYCSKLQPTVYCCLQQNIMQ